jgi:hypothetical protein
LKAVAKTGFSLTPPENNLIKIDWQDNWFLSVPQIVFIIVRIGVNNIQLSAWQ